MTAVMLCKRKAPNDMTKVFAQSETASEKTPKTIHGCEVQSHECTRQRVESFQSENHEHQIAKKNFDYPLYFGAQVDSDATSDEHSGSKSRSRQVMDKISRPTQHNIWRKSRARRRLSWKHKETKKGELEPQ